MAAGIGVDILRISRVQALLDGGFAPFLNLFTENERKLGESRPRREVFYAERFACKEAVFKCFDLAMDTAYLAEIEILNTPRGKPTVKLYGAMKRFAGEKGVETVHISISYDGEYVAAYALAE